MAKQYLTAEDLMEMFKELHLSKDKAKRIIGRANRELKEEGAVIFAGKAPIGKLRQLMPGVEFENC